MDGNGLILVKENKVIYVKKGVDYKTYQIANKLAKTDYDYALFHTRIRSVGKVSDNNCHPFRFGSTYVMMNGTESGYSGIADMLGITDTEAALRVAKTMKVDVCEFFGSLGSNFIGVDKGQVFATSPNSYYKSISIAKEEEAIIIASSLPSVFEELEPIDKPFIWKAGEELKTKKKVKYSSVDYKYGRTYANSLATIKDDETIIAGWEDKVNEKTKKTYYECPYCENVFRKDELIKEDNVYLCPDCGTQVNVNKGGIEIR